MNGVVPLSALLNATGRGGAEAATIATQVERWVSYILSHQLKNGWLGPDDGFGGKGNTYWSGWNVMASLLQAGP